ncbi:hypothetical protein A2W14_01095 [Candidatus Gottesmanbacteria bacterium RBG_16_37_8]|uniref:Uncharacterized protein n=1 Tax=Candidatus Gottesmanbacteria bacterium RBG_16_37_8 TaxID=1798371 RepID=A0A1F5YP82_9BACT|nr:MAG: hypothetical protein A2W14_01095 [Candidatus Gottesmanbacteria bacterium RBG_16_37_8]
MNTRLIFVLLVASVIVTACASPTPNATPSPTSTPEPCFNAIHPYGPYHGYSYIDRVKNELEIDVPPEIGGIWISTDGEVTEYEGSFALANPEGILVKKEGDNVLFDVYFFPKGSATFSNPESLVFTFRRDFFEAYVVTIKLAFSKTCNKVRIAFVDKY